ncbi:hypothetical protein OG21DRAFT_1605154 [Imleria badia]|nr:hypothetical protein OG21DRAFT_1605154 [Imleria badia]
MGFLTRQSEHERRLKPRDGLLAAGVPHGTRGGSGDIRRNGKEFSWLNRGSAGKVRKTQEKGGEEREQRAKHDNWRAVVGGIAKNEEKDGLYCPPGLFLFGGGCSAFHSTLTRQEYGMACPLDDPTYLRFIVETIADQRSIHTLLDAYATFVNRIRAESHTLQACHTPPPALASLRTHKVAFIRALRRDVRLAHFDPFSRPSLHVNINSDTKQYARDSSALCHHALCVLTTIFRFPAIHIAFSEHDLSSLFGDVLDIALADQLPVLNQAKTYSLSIWALGCHRLPLAVLGSRRDDVFSALRRSLDVARQPGNIVLDGLKAISLTIERDPSSFLDLLFPLLPHVITNLNGKSLEHHLHASIALGKFANALMHQTELSLTKWKSLSNVICSVLESCCDESQVASGTTSFLGTIRAAYSADSHARHPVAPAWILAVLASLIVLCGPNLYRKPTVLHFILQSLAMALTHKRSVVRALHPHVWRCFVWTFSQMLLSAESVEPALISSAFHVIKQEVSGGIGVALATVLFSDRMSVIQSDERGSRVSQALLVINAMVRTECKHTRREAFMFLQALTNDAQIRHQILQNMYEMPASVLLNGAIVRAEWDSLPSTINSIPKVPVSVRWPEETEIARHYKTLLEIWKHFASKADTKHLDSSLVDVWLSILLACSHQLECEQHIATITEMLRFTAAIIIEFFPPVALRDCQPDWGSWNVHDQLCSLTFIDQLWSAMRRAFVALGLAEVAELILTSILKYAFHVLDPGVRTVWGKLCANLMMTASPSFLRNMHDLTTSQLVIRSQRELWGVVATSLSSSELSLDWKELVKFLVIPVCTWVLSEPELEAWEALLRNAITISGDSAMVIEHVVSQYFRGKEVETWDSIMTVLAFLLTCTHDHGNSPPDDLLSTIDVCLTVCYSRARHSPEALTYSLQLLSVIRHVIVSAPGNVMRILHTISSSLCLWIEDHTEVMSDVEFNSVVVTLYCEALKALELLPLSTQSLQDMESFLASAFSRIPTPAIAPFAFENFWRATYHGQTQFCHNLPPKIKSCLSCFVAAYGGDLANGLSLTTESQSQSIYNGSQVHSPTSYQRQDVGEFGPPVFLSTSINAVARPEMEVASHEPQNVSDGEADTTFLMPSPDDDVLQPTVLRQLQEYTSRMDASSLDGSERSMGSARILLSPILPPSGAKPRSHSPEKIHLVTSYVRNQKRKLADHDDAPQKRSRTSRGTLRTVRKLESEPATRDVTPVDVPRTNSVPLKKRKVFDGVQVPTFREISRRKMVQRAETSKSTIDPRQSVASAPKTPSSSRAWSKSRTLQPTLPSSVGSDEDDLDWENFRVDETSSEADVDRSLVDAYPSSPLRARTFVPHDSDGLPSGTSPRKAMSQCESSPSAPTRPSLRRAKTTSARLDALRDVYSSVANGASQIPLPELVQATKLVHQIGAVLTEQMGKKMGDPR